MEVPLLLYYITDRTQFSGDESQRRSALLQKIAEAARSGVDFIQLREKDLGARHLAGLARGAVAAVREGSTKTRLLLNSRSDVAVACAADGVHLRSDDISAEEVRRLWARSTGPSSLRSGQNPLRPVIGVSCHTVEDVARAASEGADFVVFAPVFEKRGLGEARVTGIDELRRACSQGVPVLALGGITLENARSCTAAGAAGIAAIRLFQENDVAEVVRVLCG